MPYLKPSGYKIPKEVVEHTPDIKKKEAVFTKKNAPFSELEKINGIATKDSVEFNSHFLKDRFYHTHIQPKNIKASYICMPSWEDIVSYFNQKKGRKMYISGIFIIDEKTGKNIGRTFYTFTDKTDKLIDNLYERYKKFISKDAEDSLIKELLLNCDEYTKKLLESNIVSDVLHKKRILLQLFLKQKLNNKLSIKEYYNVLTKDLGIKIRFVPMPGYKFNKNKLSFEKEWKE